jgi:SAM-dependent methyltransferase
MEKQWYESWFDSPYYHILYKKRDDNEAQGFIDNLIDHLNPHKEAKMLDLACGKGRFSKYLADKGFEVTGLDLSENSIEHARQYESDNLSFFTQDMRKVFRINYFDFIFSFFTSFGYFESEKDDLKSLKSVAAGLNKNGVYVLDFFNTQYVIDNLIRNETKVIDGIDFNIQKKIKGLHVFKNISFTLDNETYHFEERVRLFTLSDFEKLIEKAGLSLVKTFGDYQLSDFQENLSPRLILVLKKKNRKLLKE